MSNKDIDLKNEKISNLSEINTEQAQQVSGAGKAATTLSGEIKARYLRNVTTSDTKMGSGDPDNGGRL